MNDYFRFRQFTIYQDRTSMKVGTDGVLLGAWTEIADARNLLDIGAGTGLISLMLAQRSPQLRITGVELEEHAYKQALENITISPWADRIQLINDDIRNFATTTDSRFDLIVSNPPYHRAGVKSPDNNRQLARHADSLPFCDLLECIYHLLSSTGHFCVILPVEAISDFVALAYNKGLYLEHRTNVISRVGKSAKRVLLRFTPNIQASNLTDELIIQTESGAYTDAMSDLTKDFYL